MGAFGFYIDEPHNKSYNSYSVLYAVYTFVVVQTEKETIISIILVSYVLNAT